MVPPVESNRYYPLFCLEQLFFGSPRLVRPLGLDNVTRLRC